MWTWFYDNCRQFLERMMEAHPDNMELVKAYSNLISKVAELELKFSEHNTDYNKNYDKNRAEVEKTYQSTQADVAKKQIEKSQPYGR